MRRITDWINRRPVHQQLLAHRYGVWVVLLACLGLAWCFDSREELVYFNAFRSVSPAKSKAEALGHVIGFILGGLIKYPLRLLPMLGISWALTVLHDRYLFVRLAVGTSWRKKSVYAGLMLGLWWGLTVGMTAWLGFDQLSSPIVTSWLGVAVLFGYLVHFRRLRTTRRQLTAQKIRAELDALKAQINPHFLFNSLNNIFGTALTENGPRTADSVQQLARLLRYMLEQADTDQTPVEAELRFVDEYVLLQKQRLSDSQSADVQFGYEWDEEPAQVAPLLLSPLLDYAFRQRMETLPDSTSGFLHANATVQARQLQFVLAYTRSGGPTEPTDELQNVRQRLALLYPGRHQFTLTEQGPTAHLELTINLN